MENRTPDEGEGKRKRKRGEGKGGCRRRRAMEASVARCCPIGLLTERERWGKGGYRRVGMVVERPLRHCWVATMATRWWKTRGWSRNHRTWVIAPVPRIGFLKMKMNGEAGNGFAGFTNCQLHYGRGFLKKKSRETGEIVLVSRLRSRRQRLRRLAASWRPSVGLSGGLPSLLFFPFPLISFLPWTTRSRDGHRGPTSALAALWWPPTSSLPPPPPSLPSSLFFSFPLSLFSSSLVRPFVSLSVCAGLVRYGMYRLVLDRNGVWYRF